MAGPSSLLGEKMVSLTELRKMQVVSSDGKLIGTVEDACLTNKWAITGYTIKMDKAVAKSLGKPTPVFGSPRLEIAIDQIKSIGDKLVLAKPVNELGEHFTKHEGVYHISKFVKMQVVGTGGKVLGLVKDINIDRYSWKTPSLQITVSREVMDHLKIKKPMFGKGGLTLSMTHVENIKDYVMLNTDHEGLARLLESSPIKGHTD